MEDRYTKAKALGAKYAIEIEGEDKIIFLKEPTKPVYQAWFALHSEDLLSANETVIRTLAIKECSDMDALEDIKSLGSMMGQLAEIMALKKSNLKTL